ncbi:MAG: hypothetical protein ACFFAU_01020 [Candidatus Hodarchaeota archaeon]
MKKCFICGKPFEDSKVAIIGESNFCPICRQIKDKKALYAIASLAKQINNIARLVSTFHKKELKELENAEKNSSVSGHNTSEEGS